MYGYATNSGEMITCALQALPRASGECLDHRRVLIIKNGSGASQDIPAEYDTLSAKTTYFYLRS